MQPLQPALLTSDPLPEIGLGDSMDGLDRGTTLGWTWRGYSHSAKRKGMGSEASSCEEASLLQLLYW